MSRIFTLEYEHTYPIECWSADLTLAPGVPREIWGHDAGKPTGQRFLRDETDVQDEAHALAIVRNDACRGFGTILHSVTPQPDGYVRKGFRKKDPA